MTSSSSTNSREKSQTSKPPAYYPQEYQMVSIPLSLPQNTNHQPAPIATHPFPKSRLDFFRRKTCKGYLICILIAIITIIASIATGLRISALVEEHHREGTAGSATTSAILPAFTFTNSSSSSVVTSAVIATQTSFQFSVVTITATANTSPLAASSTETETDGVKVSEVLSSVMSSIITVSIPTPTMK